MWCHECLGVCTSLSPPLSLSLSTSGTAATPCRARLRSQSRPAVPRPRAAASTARAAAAAAAQCFARASSCLQARHLQSTASHSRARSVIRSTRPPQAQACHPIPGPARSRRRCPNQRILNAFASVTLRLACATALPQGQQQTGASAAHKRTQPPSSLQTVPSPLPRPPSLLQAFPVCWLWWLLSWLST